MQPRIKLHELLKETAGGCKVYFQPPESIRLTYPCVIYGLSNYNVRHANNALYIGMKQYTFTYITTDPDTDIPEKFLNLLYCGFDRAYTSDNLYHYVFRIYH